MRKTRRLILASLTALSLLSPGMSPADTGPTAPDILILGDSQLSFGAGKAFLNYFNMATKFCAQTAGMSVGVIGVRSTALAAWTARSKKGKGALCDIDPKWKVNAGSYGTLNHNENPYIQIGQGALYQFCKPERSGFEAMFAKGYYAPKLLIMFFLGNAESRWAASPEAALADAKATMAQLPPDLPCIFMTTAPVHGGKVNKLRSRAQENIRGAFTSIGSRCSFVDGYTKATLAANQNVSANFRRKPSGAIKDPFHPTESAARAFLSLRSDALCAAISAQLK